MKIKCLFVSILICLSSVIYLWVASLGFEAQNIRLEDYVSREDLVLWRGRDFKIDSRTGKTPVFAIQFWGMDKKLGVYRMSRNYDDLLEEINKGDLLKVYYKSNDNRTENVNIDLIQIEKDG
ncbi:MAG: hypothetical protein LBV41_03270, partial [Cytophagaceae bacterium]|nr:hypothetical protein [Cytophagaceae bacterium]